MTTNTSRQSPITNHDDCAIKLFKKSVLKQEKWKQIKRLLPDLTGKTCLDLGADNGVISYVLRQEGGEWSSADIAEEAVASIKSLVGERVYLLKSEIRSQKSEKRHPSSAVCLPFNDSSFDVIVIVDMLEHVHDDARLVAECRRCLKPGGVLIANVPERHSFSFIRPLRDLFGLTDEKHGHVRPGYSRRELAALLDGFSPDTVSSYSKFFSECIDAVISFAVEKVKGGSSAKGTLVVGDDIQKHKKLLSYYTLVYPFLWLFSCMDGVLFFMSGHKMILKAIKSE